MIRVFRTSLIALALIAFVGAPAALANAKSDARAQVAFGIKAAQNGLWDEAMFRWEKAVKLDPTYAAAFNDLAVAYEYQGLPDKARAAYEKAIKLDPENDQIRQNYEMFREINDRTSRHPR